MLRFPFIKQFILHSFFLLLILPASAVASAQDMRGTVEAINRFAATNQQLPRERFYIHTDRDWYSLQDRIWFSAYVTKYSRNFLSDSLRFFRENRPYQLLDK